MGERRYEVAERIVLGCAAAGVSLAVVAPMERVRILLQTQAGNARVLSGEVEAYADAWDCFFRVVEEQGFLSLYRGASMGVVRQVPQQLVALLLVRRLEQALPSYDRQEHPWKHLASSTLLGGLAGALSYLACAPLDLARVRMASDLSPGPAEFGGFAELCSAVLWRHGVLGFFTGALSAVSAAFVYRAAQVSCLSRIQSLNPFLGAPLLAGAGSSFAAVLVARTVVCALVYPLETVRRHMLAEAEVPDRLKLYRGSVDCGRQIFARDGVSGFFAGFAVEVARGFTSSSMILLYEIVKKNMLA